MTDWLALYHRLPPGMRSIAASARGYILHSWRYGKNHEDLVAEALARESWTPAQWKSWQEERLASLLHRAATQVPFYKEGWAKRRQRGDRASWAYLENWPVLEKETLRAAPLAFVAEDCNPHQMYHEHTSGTTGKSLDLWWSRTTVQHWYALFEARGRRWYGVSRHDRWAMFGGQLVVPVAQHHPPFWVWNQALHQLYCSSYHLAPDWMPHYFDALSHAHIRYIWGYTSSLYALAQEAIRAGRTDLRFSVAITNAEPLYDFQRAVIEQAFRCPVRETYGMAEIVASATECEHARLHLWPEAGIVEIFDGNSPLPVGESGELTCTGLINMDMPLIRYRVGDTGALASPETPCPCGRHLPVLAGVEGRVDDLIITPDGRRIGRLDPVFKTHLPVREAQIIQESLDVIRIRYVPAPDYTPAAGQSMADRLQARVGNVKVILEACSDIPREANGKFRAVISHLSQEQKRALA
jgi:phenylacetate-CoA ligase